MSDPKIIMITDEQIDKLLDLNERVILYKGLICGAAGMLSLWLACFIMYKIITGMVI